MANLSSTVSRIFDSSSTTTRGTDFYHGHDSIDGKRVYLEIPINKPSFELPCFVYNSFNMLISVGDRDKDALVVALQTMHRTPRYVTMNRYLQDLLVEDYQTDKLVELKVKVNDNLIKTYYITQGAIFTEDYTPIMLCTWQVERIPSDDGKDKFKFTKPVVRIRPDVYVEKTDAMQKFIATKLPILALERMMYYPAHHCDDIITSQRLRDLTAARVVIDEIPFVLKRTDVPSISTTREKLLKCAIDHIDEIIP